MIATAIQSGSAILLYDQAGYHTGNLHLGNGEMIGHSSQFVVVRYGERVVTLDERQNQLGSNMIPEEYQILSITDSGFCARAGNMMLVFDSYCNNIDRYPV